MRQIVSSLLRRIWDEQTEGRVEWEEMEMNKLKQSGVGRKRDEETKGRVEW